MKEIIQRIGLTPKTCEPHTEIKTDGMNLGYMYGFHYDFEKRIWVPWVETVPSYEVPKARRTTPLWSPPSTPCA